MILFELRGQTEDDSVYRKLEHENRLRQLDFLRSIVKSALVSKRTFLSQTVIKALNYHAIACLHSYAGEYRPCSVTIRNSVHPPPEPHRIAALMDDFVDYINFFWERSAPTNLASFVLWRLNWIHPFINGNGRTARAACYFVLCVRSGGWLGGDNILPDLILQNRDRYVDALEKVDKTYKAGKLSTLPLRMLIEELLNKQIGKPSRDAQ